MLSSVPEVIATDVMAGDGVRVAGNLWWMLSWVANIQITQH